MRYICVVELAYKISIIDSEHASESWSLQKTEDCKKGELKIKRLKKDFGPLQ